MKTLSILIINSWGTASPRWPTLTRTKEILNAHLWTAWSASSRTSGLGSGPVRGPPAGAMERSALSATQAQTQNTERAPASHNRSRNCDRAGSRNHKLVFFLSIRLWRWSASLRETQKRLKYLWKHISRFIRDTDLVKEALELKKIREKKTESLWLISSAWGDARNQKQQQPGPSTQNQRPKCKLWSVSL